MEDYKKKIGVLRLDRAGGVVHSSTFNIAELFNSTLDMISLWGKLGF